MAPLSAAASRLPVAVSAGDAALLARQIAQNGFTLVGPTMMRGLLGARGVPANADAFAASWNDLPRDEYMADGGHYRRRRHAVYTADAEGGITRAVHQPHYQSLRDNPLNGGVARWFAPIVPTIGDGPILQSAIRLLVAVGNRVRRTPRAWRVEAHQFRIEAGANQAGQPTPEGMHRDGVDFVLVLLLRRVNAAHGVTTIADAAGTPLFDVRLSRPFEAMLLDDHRVRHGVSPIEPVDPARPAIRDALVVTLTG
jgi:hypothetical protein